MANSIRTPKLGNNPTSRRIAQAVDDQDWQAFRVSMKGKSTRTKLDMLRGYYEYGDDTHEHNKPVNIDTNCNICIRLDNYLKALARGGQLERGVSLAKAVAVSWHLTIRK